MGGRQQRVPDRLRIAKLLACVLCMSALVTFTLSSCGGGTSVVGGVGSGGTGITDTLVSGPINGLGSAIVNNIRFDISTASIVDDQGNPVTADQVSLGQIARIESAGVDTVDGANEATASTVQIRSQIIGPVTSADINANTLVVLGQSVFITPATWFDSALSTGFTTALVGQVVEVYGQFDPVRDQYVATRVALHTAQTYYKISGLLANFDAASSTMNIGGLTISYAGLAAANVPALVVGDLINVRLAVNPVAGVWQARSVALGRIALPDRRNVSLTGRITAWTSSQNFHLDGIPVNASNAVFTGLESAVVLGARVTAIGAASGGELIATGVTPLADETAANSVFVLYGPIDVLNTVAKTMSVHGLTVQYTAQTTFTNGSIADLALGSQVKISISIAADRSSADAQSITFQ